MRRAVVSVLLTAALVAACSGESEQLPPGPGAVASTSTAPTTTSVEAACALSDKLVPACGVLWGISTNPATQATLQAAEKDTGRTFDLVYRYHDIVADFPDDDERAVVREGRALHIAIAAREYGEGEDTVSYADIARGTYDASLRRQATGLASLNAPVFVTFEQEANQRRKLGVRGSAEDFKAAWRHVHEVYKAEGATNAVWVWVMTGAAENLSRAGQLWPGNDVVDWISWNVYNGSGCNSGKVKPASYETFEQGLKPFYDWVRRSGPALGIDPDKPMMISESGSVIYRDDLARTAGWYRQIPEVLPRYPQVKAIALWASSTSEACDYRFHRYPEVAQAVAEIAKSPLLRRRVEFPPPS